VAVSAAPYHTANRRWFSRFSDSLVGPPTRESLVEHLIRFKHMEGGIPMVARTRIRCMVVTLPAEANSTISRGALSREVLPWADPYVAGLIKKLQDEVRSERRQRALIQRNRLAAIDSTNDGILYAQ
jgi:hypothetical protein